MRFQGTESDTPPEQEWVARVSPFLRANDPHQACIQRARDAGSLTVDAHCQCPAPGPCTKPCCVLEDDA